MNAMQKVVAVSVAALCASSSLGCLNEYQTQPKVAEKKPGDPTKVFNSINQAAHIDWTERERKGRLRASVPDASVEVRSDYAVALLHIGRTQEALKILEPLAAANPKEYRVLANLGTAYELAGKLEKGREYILKAMEVNPASHEGTEWLHVKILEAKMALAKDPAWLKTHSVLGHDFGEKEAPIMPAALKGNSSEIKKISNAIVYQLRERLQFVLPPDPTVADLFFDMGNIYVASGIPKTALPFYRASLNFGDLRKPIIEARLRRFDPARGATPQPLVEASKTRKSASN